jgi:hypothetical protein
MKADTELNTLFTAVVTALFFGTMATLPLPWVSSMFLPVGSQQAQFAGAAAGSDDAMVLLYLAPAVFAFLGFGFGFCMAKVFNLSRRDAQSQQMPPDASANKARAAALSDAA